MALQQSDTAINYANQVMSLVRQIRELRASLQDLVIVNAANPLTANFWNVLNTCALASDGALGAADTPGTPNLAHVIDPRVYPNLSRVVKASDLTNALQIIVDFNVFCQGTQPQANAARPAQIDAVAM